MYMGPKRVLDIREGHGSIYLNCIVRFLSLLQYLSYAGKPFIWFLRTHELRNKSTLVMRVYFPKLPFYLTLPNVAISMLKQENQAPRWCDSSDRVPLPTALIPDITWTLSTSGVIPKGKKSQNQSFKELRVYKMYSLNNTLLDFNAQ